LQTASADLTAAADFVKMQIFIVFPDNDSTEVTTPLSRSRVFNVYTATPLFYGISRSMTTKRSDRTTITNIRIEPAWLCIFNAPPTGLVPGSPEFESYGEPELPNYRYSSALLRGI